MMLHSTLRLAFVLAYAAFAGCGLKGPLYLPEEGEPSASIPADTTEPPQKPSTRHGTGESAAQAAAGPSQEDDE